MFGNKVCKLESSSSQHFGKIYCCLFGVVHFLIFEFVFATSPVVNVSVDDGSPLVICTFLSNLS